VAPEILVVLMNGRVAGKVFRNGTQLRFEYNDEYRHDTAALPLSVSMPLQVRSYGNSVITPWMWGLLPDNDAVLARWSREFKVSAASPFALLSSPIGEDCAGAIQFVSEERLDSQLDREGSVQWISEDEVAERLRQIKADSTAWLGQTFTGQFSLAGAQSKTALLFQNGQWGVPSGASATNMILKPAIEGFDDHDLNEHLCLVVANSLGLSAARSSIRQFNNETAVAIVRYDRQSNDGIVTRMHQEDLCQALGVHPARKYQADGGPSPIEIAELFRRVMSPAAARNALRRFVDAMLFNWLICGTDGHAKNYSILITEGGPVLAPLYDIASALPYDTEVPKLKLAMKLGGDYRLKNHVQKSWVSFADELKIDRSDVLTRGWEISNGIVAEFTKATERPEITALKSSLPERLISRLTSRVETCQRVFAE
jgi:serine/threonine-protein kinase HipA